ncbi:neuronal membrane glycoprotein M6-b-like [Oryctolagus cuniculus]|uniref:neuronal membrane glycoprotein M6-b-like n=1 Tax=Oryctolagus cuniculus TaxID=9986 RepID=UPI00387A15A6
MWPWRDLDVALGDPDVAQGDPEVVLGDPDVALETRMWPWRDLEFACQLVSGVGRAGADTRCAVVCRGSILCGDCPLSGIIPWNAFPGKICGSALENICNTNEFYVSYHLFIVACAGAGATVVALVHVLTILSANWASLQAARDPPAKRDQELQDVRSPSTQQPHTHP